MDCGKDLNKHEDASPLILWLSFGILSLCLSDMALLVVYNLHKLVCGRTFTYTVSTFPNNFMKHLGVSSPI
jgi:hypothetical protein